jgi:hypothetical protein
MQEGVYEIPPHVVKSDSQTLPDTVGVLSEFYEILRNPMQFYRILRNDLISGSFALDRIASYYRGAIESHRMI